MFKFLKHWRELNRFRALSEAERTFVFYGETPTSMVHYGPLIEHLTGSMDQPICYVASDDKDPMLQTANPRIKAFCVGRGIFLVYFFNQLKARLMIMETPDLDRFQFKRSPHGVHYVYLFHSMMSFRIYRLHALSAYDTLFCVGPHHTADALAMKKYYNQPPCELVKYGYGRLDTIYNQFREHRERHRTNDKIRRILVAPSWGDNSILECCGEELLEGLLSAGYEVVLRPHPRTAQLTPQVIEKIRIKFSGRVGFILETDIRGSDSFYTSDLMICDWSGVALEYAFALERPVLFIDIPPKINNPDYPKFGCNALEEGIRSRIGMQISPMEVANTAHFIEEIELNRVRYVEAIKIERQHWVYNLENSGRIGAEWLVRKSEQLIRKEAIINE